MAIERGGAIGVFGISGETGEVDVPGFSQIAGLGLGVHDEAK